MVSLIVIGVMSLAVMSLGIVMDWTYVQCCFLYIVLTCSCLLIGPLIMILINIALSPKHQTGTGTVRTIAEVDAFHNMLMKGHEPKSASTRKHTRYPVVFTRLVDGALQNLLDLIFQDFIGFWLNDLAFGSEQLIDNMKQDVWGAIQSLHDRLSHVDHTKLVVCSIVNKLTFHFEKIRIAQAASLEGEDPVFILSAHLMSPVAELEYLRKISELYILFLLPRSYSLSPVKFLLREVLTCKILKPAIDLITDPDYINQKILTYIHQQQLAEAMHRKTYEYAESFEDFIRMVKSTKDLEVLKHIRYNIVTEIMQATTVQNVKRAQGLDLENNALGNSDAIRARKLKRYISQLTYAKNTCECHMQTLGWDGYPRQDSDDIRNATEITEGRILPLQAILDNVTGRRYLSQFLEQVASQGLIGYWAAVQELRAAERSNWHQLGAEIFYTYIRSPTAEIKVDKNVRKRMEAFLLGDMGPNVFYEVQDSVVKTLQEKYYPSFLVSEQYKNMQEALLNERAEGLVEDREIIDGTLSETSTLLVGERSNYARSKLDQLHEKLNNKMQALQALKSSLKPESKVLSILAKEVEWLQGEKRQLEAHLNHTEMWAEHLGRWRADVQSSEMPDNGDPPQFVLVVHMAEDEDNDESISSGWVVLRKLQDFQDLHRKLRQLCSNVKSLDLPSQPLKFFGKSDKSTLDKAKMQIQKYLNFVLEDERLNQSEALYTFLSPSSEHLKAVVTPSPKKSRFSLSTLFKTSVGNNEPRDKEDEDYSLLLDDSESGRTGTDTYLNVSKDAIAEPLYTLLGEVFDLRGVFRWLRRSLITFVQITYGRTINRQIRDTVAWVFSEPMLYYYIQLFTRAWWPNGQLVSETVLRTDEEKLKTRGEARRQFLNNVPEVLTNLVGAQSAQRGAIKVFDSLQNVNLNKQLFYDIFEVLMYEIFPELQHKRCSLTK
ncbi:SNX25 protein, partial [Pseudoatta argentina]